MDKQKLITIAGPTAAGKTGWSIEIAEEIGAEIISADSRQIYRYMDIGTAKPEGSWKWFISSDSLPEKYYDVSGVPHYLVDYIDPDQNFTLADFQKQAKKYIELIAKKDKLPMMVGGTGLYIQSVVDNFNIPEVPPQDNLRKTLNDIELDELVDLLEKVDPQAIEEIDINNPRRVVRALEVSMTSGVPFTQARGKGKKIYDTLQIGVKVDREELYQRINKRVEKMIEQGLVEEVKDLLGKGYSWDLSSMHGIGYCEFKSYFENNAELEEVVENIKQNTRNYAKRQLSWLRRDDRINWCRDISEAKKLINKFLNK